ncbi:MAG: AbrB/MazE/SpoVT family DNA-binding domain-containing protein [Pseudomonadota bacterium]
MSTTRLSSKGQVIIPKSVRVAQHWQAGTELIVIETGDGVLLRPSIGLPESSLEDVAGCLQSKLEQAKPLSLADMDKAIATAIRSQAHDRD